jgi:putative addiction module component (TIGR02574 family)
MSVDAILKEIAALTDAERAELLDRLAEQFPDLIVPLITPEVAQLLDQRVAAYEANPTEVYTWEEVYEASLRRARKPGA